MGMLLACGDGLLTWDGAWRTLPCPLIHPSHIACADGLIAAVDNDAHLLWYSGILLPCAREIEALCLWQGYALVLSGDTDCLSIADPDGWLVAARTGMYPQDMCLLPDEVLICGGADGLIHRLTLPGLYSVCTYPLPGMPMRIHASENAAHVLCTAGDDELHTLLCRIDLASGECGEIARLPGIPGAIRSDGSGGVWAAATEQLYHIPKGACEPDAVIDGFGLIRHIDMLGNNLMVSDPIEGLCAWIKQERRPQIVVLRHGEVGQACFR